MNTDQGLVGNVTQKPAGKGYVYNFVLENGTWYGHGFEKPKFNKGDYIKFAWTPNGNFKNVDASSVEIVPQAETKPQTTVGANAAAAKTDWDAKDRRITFLACRKDSLELIKLGIETGAIKLPSKGDKYDAMLDVVNRVANDLYSGIYGDDYPLTAATDTEEAAGDNNVDEE